VRLAFCLTGSCFLIIIPEYSRILNRIRVRIEHAPPGLELNRVCAIFDSIRFISTAGSAIAPWDWRLETDASENALASILSQLSEDGWHPIAYYPRKFSGAEMSNPIYDKELMAIVMSFRHWRHYLDGATETEVFSDQENLKKVHVADKP